MEADPARRIEAEAGVEAAAATADWGFAGKDF